MTFIAPGFYTDATPTEIERAITEAEATRDRYAQHASVLRGLLATRRDQIAAGTWTAKPKPKPDATNRDPADRAEQTRADLEAGITDYESAVGFIICPARERCSAGLLGIFKPLANGRVPMHRHWLGEPCEGARQKPTTPPLKLRPAP
ncbi:hypothetical protein [Streptomyces sp. NPDC048200]|uniref:hypothetical protein n=1 Tax=Streptomyces sp. NPDC048200 TaxID=3365512 RepID=UPI003713859A